MKIAVIGATGLVGESLCTILADKLPNATLQLYGNKSVGTKVCYQGKKYTILPAESVLDNLPDVAMFMANADVAKQLVPQLASKGVVCIDNSSHFRLHSNVPLVVPTINGHTIGKSKIIANPNCTTIQVAMALNCLKPLQPKRVTVATYQAVAAPGGKVCWTCCKTALLAKQRHFCTPLQTTFCRL